MGALWGWFPCGMVYSVLGIALASGRPAQRRDCRCLRLALARFPIWWRWGCLPNMRSLFSSIPVSARLPVHWCWLSASSAWCAPCNPCTTQRLDTQQTVNHRWAMYAQAIEAALAAADCFHCGLPIPQGNTVCAQIDRVERAMCCPGCRAVAHAIVDGRVSPTTTSIARLQPLRAPKRHRSTSWISSTCLRCSGHSSTKPPRNIKQAALMLDDITAPRALADRETRGGAGGVRAVEVNHVTRRARVTWDDTHIRLSGILRAIAAIGYRAHPSGCRRSDERHRRETRFALLRLGVAALGMMQVMMFASTVYFGGRRHGAAILKA